ncbi:MAG: PfkB family carbohydrate kinase [Candidatus Aminicenantes bacterium]|jgi:sugar/nucleoside kinase (ribokinase family)
MIACIGNPVFDSIETRRTKTSGRVLSGCSTNACLTLSKLGLKTTLVGRVGPDFIFSFQKQMDIHSIPYIVEKSEQSGGFRLTYHDDLGSRTLSLLGDAGKIGVFPSTLKESDWILFGPILQEVDLAYIKKIKQESKAKIFTDPQGLLRYRSENHILHKKTEEIEEIASLSDVFKPNELECRVLTGIDPREDYETPARVLKSWGSELVIITLAELGSVVYDGENFYRIPAYETDVLDSTGAGDTYAAGFLYSLKKGCDFFEAGCFASCVASIMVENCGPNFPLTLAEAKQRRERLLK